MRNERSLKVLIEPVGKQRPKATVIKGHARVYTPSKTAMYEAKIRHEFQEQYPDVKPLDCPLSVDLWFQFPYPKGAYWPNNSKHHGELKMAYMHVSKPDVDNLAKAVLDALNGIAFKDDSQIVMLTVTKTYTEHAPAVHIEMWEPAEWAN